MSISDKLTQLSEAKSAIASAIVAKGGTISGGFSTFADDINNLPTGGGDSVTAIRIKHCGSNAIVNAQSDEALFDAVSNDEGIAYIFVDKIGMYTISSSGSSKEIVVTVDELNVIIDAELSRVPVEYTELEYAVVTSGYYLNTGCTITGNTDFAVKYMKTADTQYGPHIFSNTYVFATRPLTVEYNKTSINYNTQITPKPPEYQLNTIYETKTDYKNGKETMNGVEYTLPISAQNTYTSPNIYFLNYSQPANYYGLNGRIYYGKIFEDGIPKRYYIPVRRKLDLVVGFYDLVNNTFNVGAGAVLSGGPEV